MATFQETESPTGSYGPQDASIDQLNFRSAGGDNVDLKKVMVELSYFEDIYSFSTSGYVVVRDSLGLIEKLQITGKEYIDIIFGKQRSGANNIKKSFRVYKIGDRKQNGNLNSEIYKIFFCSEELVLSEQTKVSKSYTGTKISDMIRDILVNKLKTPNAVSIEETTGLYDFVIPLLKPFEAISWLSIYARPTKTDLIGADMLLFENRNGYNFRSIASMMQDSAYTTYRYQQNNLGQQSFNDETNSVLKFEIVKTFDALNDTSSGMFANRTIVVDPLTRTYSVSDFDYNKYKNEVKPVNGQGILPSSTNRLGVTPNQSYEGSLKVLWGTTKANVSSYIDDKPGSVSKDIFADTYVKYRTAQLALANHTVVKLVIPGDPGLSVGRTINFDMLSLTGGQTKSKDKFYSGKYLVTAVRHILQSQGVYQTVVEIAKDSSLRNYQSVNTVKEG
jgi:hypothetical protein